MTTPPPRRSRRPVNRDEPAYPDAKADKTRKSGRMRSWQSSTAQQRRVAIAAAWGAAPTKGAGS